MNSVSAAKIPPPAQISRPMKIAPPAIVLAISAIFLFARLGHYALWDDEAVIGLMGQSLWQTGHLSAVLGHNIIGYRDGALLKGLYDAYQPPLQIYVVAPFVGMLGPTSFAARLPFALCGLGSVGLLLWWMHRDKASTLTQVIFACALIGNVSFYLYFRQTHYYGTSALLSLAIAYLYIHWNGKTQRALALAALLVLLMLNNYVQYLALCVCLAADYLIWGRKSLRLSRMHWTALLTPQFIVAVLLLIFRNPLGAEANVGHNGPNSLADKLLLIWWNLRELNSNEMGILLLLVLALMLFAFWKEQWLLRALLCVLVYVLVLAFTAPGSVHKLSVAEIRFASPLIPLCIFIEVLVIGFAARFSKLIAVVLAVVAFGTNALNLPFVSGQNVNSKLLLYGHELVDPPGDPYAMTSDWVGKNVSPGQSVFALPGYASYPLMFQQSKAIYAWQFSRRADRTLSVPDIFYFGEVPPDYIIAFGLHWKELPQIFAMLNARGVRYEMAAQLDTFWIDQTRAELTMRTFLPVTDFNRQTEGVYVFKKI